MSNHNEVFIKFPSEVLKITFENVKVGEWQELVNAFTTQRDGPKLDMVAIDGQAVVFQYDKPNSMKILCMKEETRRMRGTEETRRSALTRLCQSISFQLLELFKVDKFKFNATGEGDFFFPFHSESAYHFEEVFLTWSSYSLGTINVIELDVLLRQITANRFECSWIPDVMTTFVTAPITFAHAVFPKGDWITKEFLLSMECVTFRAAKTRIRMAGLNEFIREWLEGVNCVLESVSISYVKCDLVQKEVLDGIEAVPWIPKNRPQFYGSIDCSKGLDVFRYDGKVATIVFEASGPHSMIFNFYVWHEHHKLHPQFQKPAPVKQEFKPVWHPPIPTRSVLGTITLD